MASEDSFGGGQTTPPALGLGSKIRFALPSLIPSYDTVKLDLSSHCEGRGRAFETELDTSGIANGYLRVISPRSVRETSELLSACVS
jgi:hypothetical protein